jgi:hypothetical protein
MPEQWIPRNGVLQRPVRARAIRRTGGARLP